MRRAFLTASAALGLVLSLPGAQVTNPVAPAASSAPVPDSPRRVTLADAGPPGAIAAPVRVHIPSIGVDSALLRLGVDDAGALLPPDDFGQAGWFPAGPVPGDIGPAVIAGHVDSFAGPAVFFRLRELADGDEVRVDRADGTTIRFTVTATHRYPKDEFPTEDVYGPTPRAELRLITCGGDFDRSARSYRDNVVVYASRV
ncbi:class F sortase [Blastococcus sp. CT_GayMR16]|uniref:class F sortase n=1 Tax=Blastococcus sp. CT_GayMR16 TaxID=2559607 RepID=UPI00142FE074|nr:class F sortase [Blastococcus sp. CT_GayMR16]